MEGWGLGFQESRAVGSGSSDCNMSVRERTLGLPCYPKGEGVAVKDGFPRQVCLPKPSTLPAWECKYCVRKYLVDETGQDQVRSCCCSDPTLSVAWLHNLGSAIR